MPELELDNQVISYRRQGESSTAVILLHGNSGSKEVFAKQFEHFADSPYALVAIDLPGHGESGNAVDPEATYTIPGYAGIVNQVLQDLSIRRFVIAGWSLGGNIALEMAGRDCADQNAGFVGLMIFGAPPVGPGPEDAERAFLPATFESAVGAADATREQIDDYVGLIYGALDPVPASFFECAHRTEGIARENMVNHWFSGASGHKQVETVSTWEKPICVVHGNLDDFVSLEYLKTTPWRNLWRGQVQEMQHCGHAPFLENPTVFNDTLEDFVTDVF